MNSNLIGFALIGIGLLHIAAAHKEWSWYVNNYQVKAVVQSYGNKGLKWFTYLMCSPCIVYGIYQIVS